MILISFIFAGTVSGVLGFLITILIVGHGSGLHLTMALGMDFLR